MTFKKHPDPIMGLYLETTNDIFGERIAEWCFPLNNDERSQQYLAWVAEGNTPEEWNPEENI